MNELDIRTDGGLVVITNHEGKEIWQMPISKLGTTIIHDCLSERVLSLSRENWSTLDCLYKLAEIIEKKHPENIIDWEWTFALVETWFDNKQIPVWEMQDHWIQVSYQEKDRIEALVFEKLVEYKIAYHQTAEA